METTWRLLRADEIEIRTGQVTKDGTSQSLLLYKDARCDMARLDEFGQYNWQREHKDVHGVSYCGVSLWDKEKGCWVTKWDAGKKSKTEPEKGEASDSFKRACVNWGIGRELYTAPKIWVSTNIDPLKLSVSRIEYNEKREITVLVIVDNKDTVIFEKGAQNARKAATTAAPSAPAKPASVIEPKKEEKQQEQEQRMDLTAEEVERYLKACADMDAAESKEQLNNTVVEYQGEKFYDRLIEKGKGICAIKGWKTKQNQQ